MQDINEHPSQKVKSVPLKYWTLGPKLMRENGCSLDIRATPVLNFTLQWTFRKADRDLTCTSPPIRMGLNAGWVFLKKICVTHTSPVWEEDVCAFVFVCVSDRVICRRLSVLKVRTLARTIAPVVWLSINTFLYFQGEISTQIEGRQNGGCFVESSWIRLRAKPLC